MGRIAGDDPGYTFAMCRKKGWKLVPTKTTFQLPSVSTIIGEILAKPPSAMAWWGYKVACEAVTTAGTDVNGLDTESLYELLKQVGPTPNTSLEESGDRGTKAHFVLELLALGAQEEGVQEEPTFRTIAEAYAEDERRSVGTEYGDAAIAFWDDEVEPYISEGYIDAVLSEVPTFSLNHRYAGTFDLGLHWAAVEEDENHLVAGWEILDAKTHKPANGFTKPGRGPGYISDATQNRAYRTAFEEMGLGNTIGQRTIVLRDKAYRKVRWLEDDREVSEEFWFGIRRLYDERMAWQ